MNCYGESIVRTQEQSELKDIFNSNKSELAAVYGRRHVGKTYLIINYFRARKCIYFQTIISLVLPWRYLLLHDGGCSAGFEQYFLPLLSMITARIRFQ